MKNQEILAEYNQNSKLHIGDYFGWYPKLELYFRGCQKSLQNNNIQK